MGKQIVKPIPRTPKAVNDGSMKVFGDDEQETATQKYQKMENEGELTMEQNAVNDGKKQFILEIPVPGESIENIEEMFLDDGEYHARIGDIKFEEKMGKYGKWTRVTIPFTIIREDQPPITILFFSGTNLRNPENRLLILLQSMFGNALPKQFDLMKLEGTEVMVKVIYKKEDDFERNEVISARLLNQ